MRGFLRLLLFLSRWLEFAKCLLAWELLNKLQGKGFEVTQFDSLVKRLSVFFAARSAAVEVVVEPMELILLDRQLDP